LIEDVVEGEANRKLEMPPMEGHFDYVLAIVDGNTYWSFYCRDIDNFSRDWRQRIAPYVNSDLLFLTNELIDLSPPSLIDNWHGRWWQ